MKRLFKIIHYVFVAVVLSLSMPYGYIGAREIGKYLGLITFVVPLAGTGSMYPSLYWAKSEGGQDDITTNTIPQLRIEPSMYYYYPGFSYRGRIYGKTKLGRGDIVAFRNNATISILSNNGKDPQAGFIKRVIALAGDKIELRDGYVILNGKQIDEPYIIRARSSFGGSFLADCNSFVVPPDSIFVMGDNRPLSDDSRSELGVVKESDILTILPLSKQQNYQSLWRDTTHDFDMAGKPTLDINKTVELINQIRQDAKVGKLKLDANLQKSTKSRGEVMLATNDFSTTASSSGYTYSQAMDKAGYSNIATGEVISHGFFTSEEWVSSLSYYPSTAKEIGNPVYQDIGVTAVAKEINGCPTQVVVGHFGGYVPPVYDAAIIESWSKLRKNLESVLPSWQEGKGSPKVDQVKLTKLIDLFNKRLQLASEVEAAMLNKKWLSKAQEARIAADSADADIAESLVKELNAH